MIELKVQPYCHNCPDFQVAVDGPTVFYSNNTIAEVRTTVYCQNHIHCEHIRSYLRREGADK